MNSRTYFTQAVVYKKYKEKVIAELKTAGFFPPRPASGPAVPSECVHVFYKELHLKSHCLQTAYFTDD